MLQMKTTFSGRWPLMEDDLKILKADYLSSYWLDPTQIQKISLMTELNCTEISIEDDLQWKNELKIIKVEYFSNNFLDLTHKFIQFNKNLKKISSVACFHLKSSIYVYYVTETVSDLPKIFYPWNRFAERKIFYPGLVLALPIFS